MIDFDCRQSISSGLNRGREKEEKEKKRSGLSRGREKEEGEEEENLDFFLCCAIRRPVSHVARSVARG
ncbi:hypothetical protein BHE74_00011862 [Ensete ventricosum]|nr:hypothetical protein BHE74_00011862 [Ensete ventricosum]